MRRSVTRPDWTVSAPLNPYSVAVRVKGESPGAMLGLGLQAGASQGSARGCKAYFRSGLDVWAYREISVVSRVGWGATCFPAPSFFQVD
jgi:hypothetical protein